MRHNYHKMGRSIELVPHSPLWAQQFEEEAASLTAVFQPILVSAHHIGSTSIPGILAKPIIDIILVVTSITAVRKLIEPMAVLGYVSKGENGIPGRHYFRKGGDERHTHHVHTYGKHHPAIARHLDFRDYLRHHPEQSLAYSQLKKRLAQQFVNDTENYTNSKSAFIEGIVSKARLWRQKQVSLL